MSMRLSLAAFYVLSAIEPGWAAETITKSRAARLAFMAELAPHTCGTFQQNIISVAAWMTNNGLLQADLLRSDRFGPDALDELKRFEDSITMRGVDQTCAHLLKELGPSGADLVESQ